MCQMATSSSAELSTMSRGSTEIRERFPCYGYRRMTHALRRAGWCINHKRVRRLLDPLPVRQHRVHHFIPHTTAAQHAYCRHPNLLLGRTLHHLNEAWVADLTYVRPPTTFLYLACILDAYSRRCIGWALTPWLDTRVTLAALEHAVVLRQPAPGLIHHSDQGVQYASNAYIVRLRHIGAQFSMALAGNSYENALIESFFKTLRSEELSRQCYHTAADASVRTATYLDVYNTERLHSRLATNHRWNSRNATWHNNIADVSADYARRRACAASVARVKWYGRAAH